MADTNIEGDSCRQCDKLEATLERVMRDGRNKVDELEREVLRQRTIIGHLTDKSQIQQVRSDNMRLALTTIALERDSSTQCPTDVARIALNCLAEVAP